MLSPLARPNLVLIRGLPGTGKSTLAQSFKSKGYRHFEADEFFMVEGEYRFNQKQLEEAHAWCLQRVREALDAGELVCVANVFAAVGDVTPYIQLATFWQVVEATYHGRSIHKVPASTLRTMKSKWVPTDDLVKLLRGDVLRTVPSVPEDVCLPDLTFPMVNFGANEIPWDLRVLLYQGAPGRTYKLEVFQQIAAGDFGNPISERIELTKRIHEEMTAMLVQGGSRETAKNAFNIFRKCFAWAEERGLLLSLVTMEAVFVKWADFLHDRVKTRTLRKNTAAGEAQGIASVINRVFERGTTIMGATRLSKKNPGRRALGVVADKQNLGDSTRFAHLCLDLIDSLPLNRICGPLPIKIKPRDGQEIVLRCHTRQCDELATLRSDYAGPKRKKLQTMQRRAACATEQALQKRGPVINARLMAEYMLFISQTGMGATQAQKLKVTQYSFESTIDGYRVYDYKKRAKKEVLFQIFTGYKDVFEDYLALRKELFADRTDLLFPFLRIKGTRPLSAPNYRTFQEVICAQADIRFIPPRSLRSTRVNWLLRESRDPDLTAEKAQHLKRTLHRIYEERSQQVSMREIITFYKKGDPRLACPALGVCDGIPKALPNLPPEAPEPDCNHPGGCLFCEHHRDIDSEDYVWSIASMKHLNNIVLRRFPPQEKKHTDRAIRIELVLEILAAKLKWFDGSNSKRKAWVADALGKVAEGDFHIHWSYLIESAEGV